MKKAQSIWFFLLLLSLAGCVEPADLDPDAETEVSLDQILVVEATLTDQNTSQRVLLSRPVALGDDSTQTAVRGASVRIESGGGTTFTFAETDPGTYLSVQEFGAQPGQEYTLRITLGNGREYESETQSLPGNSTIERLYAERMTSDTGEEGVGIFVDGSSPDTGQADFRYTYEETYKIIAPNWSAFEFLVTDDGSDPETPPAVEVVPRAQEEQVCYNTVLSNTVILADAPVSNGNSRNGNLVRFLSVENPVISHRYSILVRQLRHSTAARSFYEGLRDFEASGDIFSQVQPGFLSGNLRAVGDEDALVVGYFEVASTTESRIFFNFVDFFPDAPLPPYFDSLNCDRILAPWTGDESQDGPVPENVTCGQTLFELIALEAIEYRTDNFIPPPECQGPYIVTPRPCGDCTALGDNTVPDFWIE